MKKGCFYCRQFWSIGNSGSLTWRSIWSTIWRPQLSSFVEGIICSYHKHQIVAAGKAGLCKSSSAGRCASITCLYWKYQVKNLIETFWWLFQCCIGNAYRMLVIHVGIYEFLDLFSWNHPREAFRVFPYGHRFFLWLFEKTRLPLRPCFGGFPVKLRTHIGKTTPEMGVKY